MEPRTPQNFTLKATIFYIGKGSGPVSQDRSVERSPASSSATAGATSCASCRSCWRRWSCTTRRSICRRPSLTRRSRAGASRRRHGNHVAGSGVRAPRVPLPPVGDLPRPDRPQRLAQVPHQHDEGLDGRAHAAPAAYVLYDYILRFPLALPPREGRRDGVDDQDEVEPLGGFIGEAFLLAFPGRSGPDRDVLHPLSALGVGTHRPRWGACKPT